VILMPNMYSFADKYSSCVMMVSAETEEEARELFAEKVQHPEIWVMDEMPE